MTERLAAIVAGLRNGNGRLGEAVVPALVVAVTLALLFPVPALVVDAMIGLSLAASAAALVTALTRRGAADLAAFPTTLVLLALLRLAAGVAAARWVALHGFGTPLLGALAGAKAAWPELAGLAVILGGIQVMVVSAGASRAAEVAARFALDALPAWQASHPRGEGRGAEAAEAKEAQRHAQAGFYAAMDGASRFLRGEVFGLALIALAALAGGLASVGGAGGAGADPGTVVAAAASVGVLLLLGAALAGTAAAIAVMRAGAQPQSVAASPSVLAEPWPLFAGAAVCLGISLFSLRSGLATMLVGTGLAVAAVHLLARQGRATPRPAENEWQADASPTVVVSPVRLLLGLGLLGLLDEGTGDIMDHLGQLRQEVSAESGVRVPGFVVADSIDLAPNEYALELQGAVAARGEVRPSRVLAIADAEADLSDGTRGSWIPLLHRPDAAAAGHTILSPTDVILRHVERALRANVAHLFDRQRAADLLASVAQTHAAVARAASAAGLDEGLLSAVGQDLLRQGVPLHAPSALVDALSEAVREGAPYDDQVTRARQSLAHVITRMFAPEGELDAVELDPVLESELEASLYMESVGGLGQRSACGLAPERAMRWRRSLTRIADGYAQDGRPAAILCGGPARRALCALLAEMPGIRIRAAEPQDILPGTRLQVVHRLSPGEVDAA